MKTTLVLVLLCCLSAAWADMSVTYGVPFSSIRTASNETIDFPTLMPGQGLASAAYSLGFNVSSPFSFVIFQDVSVAFSEDSIDSVSTFNIFNLLRSLVF